MMILVFGDFWNKPLTQCTGTSFLPPRKN